ncbi:MAG: hypothetical protein Q4A15_06470 [Prevotellaceae bacterium]|nr:hypothetical protein [Prevotellaceae bacterium]
MIYTIITDNGGGEDQIYHDIEGSIYTFPTMYRSKLLPGTQVVYHRNKKSPTSPYISTRMSDDSHYFGVAEIGAVVPTKDGNLRASIVKFKRFVYPVDIHKSDGSYYEEKPFWQQGVRPANKSIYESIIAASKFPPVVPDKKTARITGVRTTTSLAEGISSAPFCQKKYQLVTGSKGYYLKNLADGVYYELAKVANFSYREGTIKILAKKSNRSSDVLSFLVRHETSRIVDLGVFDQIENGLHFSGRIDGNDVNVNFLT